MNWETIVKAKIIEKEADDWYLFCTHHPSMQVAQGYLENIHPYQFWSIADHYPDLVKRLHVQIRLMGNFGLNGSVPWLKMWKLPAIFYWTALVLEIIMNLFCQT